MLSRAEQDSAVRAHKGSKAETIVPPSNRWRETALSLAATGVFAFAATSLFELLKFRIEPLPPHQSFDPFTIAFGALLATGLTLFGRSKVLERARVIEQERDLLRIVTDGLPAGIFAKDLDGRYVMANRKFAEYKGARSGADIVGKTAFEFMPEEEAVTVASEDFDIKSGKSSVLEFERSTIGPRGNIKWDRTTRVPLMSASGKVVGVAGIQRDITRSKRLEQRLREQEARLLAAQQIAQLGSFEVDIIEGVDLERCPMRCSSELLRIAGFDPHQAELPRSSTNIFHLVVPEDWNGIKETLAATIRDSKPYVLEFRIICRNGSQRSVQCAGDVACDPQSGRPTKLQGTVHDVTDRKRAEAQVEAANENLGKHVRELQERSKELQLLSEMGGLLQSCNAMDEAYVAIAGSVEPLFPNWVGALYIISASRNVVEAVTQWGPPVWGERVFAPSECWALRRGRLNWFNVKENTMRCHHADAPQVTESLCVPLMAHGEALGVLHLQPKRAVGQRSSTPEHTAEDDRRLAVVLAEQIGLALGNLKLRETLRNQSIRDPLTGLFNRRYMEESLEREMSRATRDKGSVAIIMLDIDHFKEFNDTFGHQAGDAALRSLGDFLKKTTRGQDIICRYGGEEFALVFGGSSVEGALERAEALRERIKHLEIQYAGQLLGTITVSMGIALFPDHGLTVAEVLRGADQALYCAKREGRDQICVWTAGSPA